MAQSHTYVCTNCGAAPGRDLLTVKKVLYLEMGTGGRTLRARVVGWLCVKCVKKDTEWNMEPNQTPQYKSESIKSDA